MSIPNQNKYAYLQPMPSRLQPYSPLTLQPPNSQMHNYAGISYAPVLVSPRKLEHINCIIPAHEKSKERERQGYGGVFIGDTISVLKADILANHNIRCILNCNAQAHSIYAPNSNIAYKSLPLQDTPGYPIINHFQQAYKFIENNRSKGYNTLVQCHAGVSRSVTIVCAYLMKKYGWNFQQTIKFVREKRARVKPNQGFIKQLMQYQIMLQAENKKARESEHQIQNTEETVKINNGYQQHQQNGQYNQPTILYNQQIHKNPNIKVSNNTNLSSSIASNNSINKSQNSNKYPTSKNTDIKQNEHKQLPQSKTPTERRTHIFKQQLDGRPNNKSINNVTPNKQKSKHQHQIPSVPFVHSPVSTRSNKNIYESFDQNYNNNRYKHRKTESIGYRKNPMMQSLPQSYNTQQQIPQNPKIVKQAQHQGSINFPLSPISTNSPPNNYIYKALSPMAKYPTVHQTAYNPYNMYHSHNFVYQPPITATLPVPVPGQMHGSVSMQNNGNDQYGAPYGSSNGSGGRGYHQGNYYVHFI